MKTSKIKEVKSVSDPWGERKILYHKLEMENGDKIDIGKIKEQQVGWELTYEIQEKGQQEYNKAKAVSPDKFKSNGQTSYSSSVKKDDVQELIVRQSSLRSSIEFCKGSNGSVEDIFYLADECYKWVMGGKPITNDKNFDSLTGSNDNKLKRKDDLPF